MDAAAAGEGPEDEVANTADERGGVPVGAALLAEVDAAEGRLAEIAGVVHGGNGALVEFMVDALARRLWEGWQIHSPAQWLAWKSGLSNRQARHVVQVAERAHELPVAVGALVAGELSLDAVRLIAAHVPSRYDEAATELARSATVSQLERVLPKYHFGPADDDAPVDGPSEGEAANGGDGVTSDDEPAADTPRSEGDGTDGDRADDEAASDEGRDSAAGPDDGTGAEAEADAQGACGGPSVGPEEKRRASFWWDDDANGHLSSCLPTDEALVMEAAMKAARADLVAERRAELGEGAAIGRITEADVLLRLASSYLAGGRSAKPGADRYLIHAHLEQRPGDEPVLRGHLGPIVPDALRRLLTCDAETRPVWHRDGVALSVGRAERIVPDRARRIIEHRDGGCVVPGCGRRAGLDVHHIRHWEHGGSTDTHNLCCLCRRHHRQHHLGLLGIEGDADDPGGLVIKDRWGRVLEPAGAPEAIGRDDTPTSAADRRRVPRPVYDVPFGERMNARDVWLAPGPPSRAPGPEGPKPPSGLDPSSGPPTSADARDPRGDPEAGSAA